MMHFFVLTSAQADTAAGLDDPPNAAGIYARPIDSATPGSGLNINELADGYAVGDPITLTGKKVIPYRVVNDPNFLTYVPDLVTFLLTLPSALLEQETIFLPFVDD